MPTYAYNTLIESPSDSSPGDRAGGESLSGTPDTTLTAFSPEEVLRRGSIASSIGGVSLDTGRYDDPSTGIKDDDADLPDGSSKIVAGRSELTVSDPFVTTNTRKTLSATASVFKPGSSGESSGSITIGGSITPYQAQFGVIANQKTANDTTFGVFTTSTKATRCLKIESIYDADAGPLIKKLLVDLKAYGIDLEKQTIETRGNTVYLHHPDIRVATVIYTTIRTDHPGLSVEYMRSADWALIGSPSGAFSAYEGQILVTVSYPEDSTHDKRAFEDHIRTLLADPDDLVAWQKSLATEAGTFALVAEFGDADKAKAIVATLNGIRVKVGKTYKPSAYPYGLIEIDQEVVVSLRLHQPDAQAVQRLSASTTPTRNSTSPGGRLENAFGQLGLSAQPPPSFNLNGNPLNAMISRPPGTPFVSSMGHLMTHNGGVAGLGAGVQANTYFPYGILPLTQSYSQPNFGLYPGHYGGTVSPGFGHSGRQNPNRQNAGRPHRNSRHANDANCHHNQVEVIAIRLGHDVRTTVMLRNIPNRLTQAQLKVIVDMSSFGKYDFMYLRIDFSNGCNVGYAFINFLDPLDIIESDKVAEVSYATIQGRDCLIQKFRNSSVMLEPPHCRPKLFYTLHDGELAGEEEVFPASDNASKLKRSCENAEHVGLFAPNGGGSHARDEQRRRRGLYDRGTSLAEREEFGFDDPFSHFGGYDSY
ncbi:RNA recognition motif 2-domain-containing protein [Bisporella sp. PMI_857]|nr:RNA recognition motif 2-domain-containing protein [Bisporella sp. PMI_857]